MGTTSRAGAVLGAALLLCGLGALTGGCHNERYRDDQVRRDGTVAPADDRPAYVRDRDRNGYGDRDRGDVGPRNPLSPGGVDGKSLKDGWHEGRAGDAGYSGSGGGRYGVGRTERHGLEDDVEADQARQAELSRGKGGTDDRARERDVERQRGDDRTVPAGSRRDANPDSNYSPSSNAPGADSNSSSSSNAPGSDSNASPNSNTSPGSSTAPKK